MIGQPLLGCAPSCRKYGDSSSRGEVMRKFVTFPLVGLLGLVMALGLVTAAGAQAQAAAYRMQIHEIYYNSPGPDYGGNASLNHEWVQLHNQSGSSIDLINWTLRDKAGHIFLNLLHIRSNPTDT